ncbi:MAG TPA: hypothetical protein VG408_10685, partial [Actinomycetota bacterium]|nr:hypothetical protein [Actinomycetota bacterium]
MSIARRPDRLIAILLSLALFVALPLTAASAQTSGDPGFPGTYYFHSVTGDNTRDQAQGGATFNPFFPTRGSGQWATARDLPGLQNTSTSEVVDPTWRGSIDERATSLSVNFWALTRPDQDLFGTANYTVRVRPAGGTVYYELLPAIADRAVGGGVANIHQTFTKMRTSSTASEVPLDLPAGPLTFTIRGTFFDSNASTELRFDSIEYPSSFTVNGVGPTPTPSPTPTPADPNAFYLHSGTRVGQADRADGSSTFDGFEPTDTEPARFVDLPHVRNGSG